MGRIKTKSVKRLTMGLLEAYPDRFTQDFAKNKEALNGLNLIHDKRVRNSIAGYLARLKKKARAAG